MMLVLPAQPPRPLHSQQARHDALLNEVVSRYLDATEQEPFSSLDALQLDSIGDHLAFLWAGWTVAAAREVHGVGRPGEEFTRHAVLLLRHRDTGTWVGLDLLLEMVSGGRTHTSWAGYSAGARLRAVAAQVVEARRLVIADSLPQMAELVGADVAALADGSTQARRMRLLRLAVLLLRLHGNTGSATDTTTGSTTGSMPAADGHDVPGRFEAPSLSSVLAEEGRVVATLAALGGFHDLAEQVAAETALVDAGHHVPGVTVG